MTIPASQNRITAKQYYDALLQQNERMDILERRIMAHMEMMRSELKCMATTTDYDRLMLKMDTMVFKFEQYALKSDVDKLEDRVDKLTMRDSIWNGINSFGVIVAATIAAVFGSKE